MPLFKKKPAAKKKAVKPKAKTNKAAEAAAVRKKMKAKADEGCVFC